MKQLTILFALFFFLGTAHAFDAYDGDEKEKEKDKEKVLNVSGMMCGNCENKVKTELKKVEGVKEVKASHSENKVKLILAADHASDEEFAKVIKEAGFEVVKYDEKKDKDKDKKKKKDRRY